MARFVKGQIPWNKGLQGYRQGHQVSLITRLKISKANTKLNPKTPLNQLLRKSPDYKNWRKSVFERDNYTCQDCGNKKDIHPHHIKPFAKYPELRFNVDNGKTLCSLCHGKLHGLNFSKSGTYLSCSICKIRFRPKSGHLQQQTCSKKCGYEFRSKNPNPRKGKHYPHLQRSETRSCLNCGKSFRVTKDFKNRKQKYCSHPCYLKIRWNFTGQKPVIFLITN